MKNSRLERRLKRRFEENTTQDIYLNRKVGQTMIITETKIRSINTTDESRLKAIVSITIDNCLAIHDIKVIEGDDRLFVAMPSRKENGVFRDIVHPIDEKTRNMLEDAILESYTRYVMTIEAADIR